MGLPFFIFTISLLIVSCSDGFYGTCVSYKEADCQCVYSFVNLSGEIYIKIGAAWYYCDDDSGDLSECNGGYGAACSYCLN